MGGAVDGRRDAVVLCEAAGDPEVLEVLADREARVEAPGQDLLADLVAHRVRAARAAVDAVHEPLRVQARADPHRQRLGGGGEVGRREHVVDRLGGVAVARLVADVDERAAEVLEQRPRACHQRGAGRRA